MSVTDRVKSDIAKALEKQKKERTVIEAAKRLRIEYRCLAQSYTAHREPYLAAFNDLMTTVDALESKP